MKKIILLMIAAVTFSTANAQTKAAGVSFPAKETFKGKSLNLNGVGVREKFWMDMYAGALYVSNKSKNSSQIMNADEAMALRIHIVSKLISSDKMIEAVDEGFQNSTNKNTAPIASEITKFKSFFKDEITQNDVFDIVYDPSTGTTVYKNGVEKGNIKGAQFKKSLFGIWLGSKPADEKLKKGMMGN